MLISHECPISLLKESKRFNDYDYALVHLFETEPDYYDYFVESLEQGRKVILDNSIFELGQAFDSEKFLRYIKLLKPTEYIIPDALEDCLATMDNALDWKEKYLWLIDENVSKSIGVVQGKSYEDLVNCYQYLDEVINVDICPHPNKWMGYTMGRVTTLSRMLEDGIINQNKPHHLLGCALPIEFMFYREGFEWLESLDTSNPVVHAILNISYEYGGLVDKQSIKLVDLLHSKLNQSQFDLVRLNTTLFKSFVKGSQPHALDSLF
jgi:hypothetical protein